MAWSKNTYRTKRAKYAKRGIPKAVIPHKVSDKHIAQVAKKAIRIRQEEKFKKLFYTTKVPQSGLTDGWTSDTNPTAAQNLFRLNTIEGTGVSTQPGHATRDGLEIEAVKVDISMRSYFSQTPTLTVTQQIAKNMRFRTILFWYDQFDNNIIGDSDYPMKTEMFNNDFGTTVPPPAVPILPYSQVDYIYNPTYKNKFQILFDKTYTVGNMNNLVHTMNRTFYLKNKKVKYDRDVTTATDGIHKALFFLILTDNPVGSSADTNGVTKHELNACFHFRDI